jgi:hypothetical protein
MEKKKRKIKINKKRFWLICTVLGLVIASVIVLAVYKQPGWHTFLGNTYYINSDGEKTVGWLELDSQKYYFDTEGSLQYGWQEINDEKYYLLDDGAAATGTQAIDGTEYYFDETGVIYQGWRTVDTEQYYYGENGLVVTGWQEIDGTEYCFKSDGELITNTTKDGYEIDADGKASLIPLLDISEYDVPTNGSYGDDEELDAMVDEIFAEIITDDMTGVQKLYAVYDWMMEHLRYRYKAVYFNDISDEVVTLAKQALDDRAGSCYHYAALSQYMLDRLGYQVLIVHAQCTAVGGGYTEHFWNMVAYEGQWYHWDVEVDQAKHREYFLAVSSQLKNKSHKWNASTIPQSATTSIPIPSMD